MTDAVVTPPDRTITRSPASSRVFTRWTTDDLEAAEALTNGGTLQRSADLCWALLGDGRVRAALETRVKGLLACDLAWDNAGNRRSSGRVVRMLEEEGDWYVAHSEAALASLALWGTLLGVGLNQRVWVEHDGREIGVHRPYDVRNLRWDPERRLWTVRTREGEEDILPGSKRWVLYAPSCSGMPDGDERPWMYGAWRACARPWLGKLLAWGDWQHHSEIHGSPIRTADHDDTLVKEPCSKDLRDKFGTVLGDIGADAGLIPPPGLKLRLVEAVGKTWGQFPEIIDTASREVVIAITGQASSTEVQQGQETGATLHALVRQDLIDADARTLSTCLREQDLCDYAEINFGNRDLAPWPRWQTDPPADARARGAAMKSLADGIEALERVLPPGKMLDRQAEFEVAGIRLLDAPAPPQTEPA